MIIISYFGCSQVDLNYKNSAGRFFFRIMQKDIAYSYRTEKIFTYKRSQNADKDTRVFAEWNEL